MVWSAASGSDQLDEIFGPERESVRLLFVLPFSPSAPFVRSDFFEYQKARSHEAPYLTATASQTIPSIERKSPSLPRTFTSKSLIDIQSLLEILKA